MNIKICDRCKKEINPKQSAITVLVKGREPLDLCGRCALYLNKYLSGEVAVLKQEDDDK